MKIGAMNHPEANIKSEIDWIAKHFDFIDLTLEAPASYHINAKELGKMLTENHLATVGHTSPSLPAVYPIEEIRRASIQDLKRSIDIFKAIGVEKVTIHPFYDAPNLSEDSMIEANLKVFAEVNSYCKTKGIILMVENYLSPFDTVEIFNLILEAAPEAKIHLDVGHCNLEGNAVKTVERFFHNFGDRIIHLHMHDNDGDADEHLPVGCGCGDIHWSKIIEIIKHSGYDGTITLEVFCEDPDYLLLSRDKLRKLWEAA